MLKNRLAAITAVVVTAAYLVFAVLLWLEADEGDPGWSHRHLVYSGVEAIAFAGLGWLFGREVNRHAVTSAAEATERAHEAARQLGAAEGKGRALAAAIRAEGEAPREGLEAAPSSAPRTARVMADRLFPED